MLSIAVEYERRKPTLLRLSNQVNLRGNLPITWVPPELRWSNLPVSAFAFSVCPTSRDLYFEYVARIGRGASWSRYIGCVIDHLYKGIFRESQEYCKNVSARDFDIFQHLADCMKPLIDEATIACKSKLESIERHRSGKKVSKFLSGLNKIVRFEALQISSLMEYELSRVTDSKPSTVFAQFFSINTDPSLRSLHQGFSVPATPDFILGDRVVGDIKYGRWKEYFEYTMVAYALAYEDHHEFPMDLGAILQVELLESRRFPTHIGTRIDLLDDAKRQRFLAIRNRKLQIVTERIDPGRAESKDMCDSDCSYYDQCW